MGHGGPKLYNPGLWLSKDEHLRVSTWAVNAEAVEVRGLFLDEDGEVRPFEFVNVSASNRTIVTTTHALGPGWLLSVTAVRATSGRQFAECYVRLDVIRGLSGATMPVALLVTGYATGILPLAWPGHVSYGALDGPGRLRSITGTDPAAGVEISETVPNGALWQLLSLQATLVADATVASRIPSLLFDDATSEYGAYFSGSSVAASQTSLATWGSGQGFRDAEGNNALLAGFGTPLFLLEGHRIRTETSSLQAGDNWGAPQYLVREWLDVYQA